MRASATHIVGEIERCGPPAYAETVHFDCIAVLHHAILWYFRDASVHCAGKYPQSLEGQRVDLEIIEWSLTDSECLRSATGCKRDHGLLGVARHLCKYWIAGDRKTIWETQDLLVVDGANIPQLHWSE